MVLLSKWISIYSLENSFAPTAKYSIVQTEPSLYFKTIDLLSEQLIALLCGVKLSTLMLSISDSVNDVIKSIM